MLRSNPDDDPFLQFRVASGLSRLVHARLWLASQLDVAWTHAAIERQIKRLFACGSSGRRWRPTRSALTCSIAPSRAGMRRCSISVLNCLRCTVTGA